MITIFESNNNINKLKENEVQVLDKIKIDKSMLDINFTSEYLNLHSLNKSTFVIYFLFQEHDTFYLEIFYKNKINIKSYTEYYDIETPYGYGGPFTNSNDEFFIKRAQKKLEDWCKSQNILCKLTRFNPFLPSLKKIISLNQNVYRIKKLGIFKINTKNIKIENYDQKTRNMIRKNLKNGTEFMIVNNNTYNFKQLRVFTENYISSMKNKKVDKFYYFNDDYYNKLEHIIKANKGFLINAYKSNVCVGGAIFLYNNSNSYYHLSYQKNVPGIMNSIIFVATKYLYKLNKKLLLLGGGNLNSEDDNLLKFKLKMSNSYDYFYLETKIFNSKVYSEILEKLNFKQKNKLFFYR